MKTNFISKYQKLRIWGHKEENGKKVGFLIAGFEPIGNNMGGFSTDDEDLINTLLKHSLHGRDFSVLKDKMPHFEDATTIVGAVTSIKEEEIKQKQQALEEEKKEFLAKVKEEREKAVRYGVLKAQLLKSDGTFRKDATEDLKTEYEKLKIEIGE